MSDEVDAELHRALVMNPRDSVVLRSLGIRMEGKDDRAQAESYLLQATAVDHTFLPQWALVNFYRRTGRMDRLWPAVHQCLTIIEPKTLDPRRIDPDPVFDLCWNATSDSKKILALVPPGLDMLLPYLRYLVRTRRFDAAAEALPSVLALRQLPESYLPTYLDVCEDLIRENRTAPAILIWNRLVDSRRIHSTLLDPVKAQSLADADFTFPSLDRAFGWRLPHDDNVFIHEGERFLDFEMALTGNEHFELLSKVAPVLAGRSYRLSWRVDTSHLDFSSRENPGLTVHVYGPEGELSPACPPLLSKTVNGCLFRTSAGTSQLRFVLRYDRPVGGRRLEGVLRLQDFALEFQ